MASFRLSDRTNIFWLLALEGADLLWINKKGQNLAHLLMHHRASHEEILNVLFDTGVDPAATDLDCRTLAHHGAIHGVFTKDLLKFLEHRGVLDLHETRSARLHSTTRKKRLTESFLKISFQSVANAAN